MNDKEKSSDTMNNKHKKTGRRKGKSGRIAPATRGETLIKGVVMGLVISNANQATRSVVHALIRHPLALFSTGLVTGYMTYKYRKEIIAVGTKTAEESKNFALRQKEHLFDLVAECREQQKDPSM